MGVRILVDKDERMAALYCSTSDWAFGPIFYEMDDGTPAEDAALEFIRGLKKDARRYSDRELEKEFVSFLETHRIRNEFAS